MRDEISSLNASDIDVELLEQRIEMSSLIPPVDTFSPDCTCPNLQSCVSYCNSQ